MDKRKQDVQFSWVLKAVWQRSSLGAHTHRFSSSFQQRLLWFISGEYFVDVQDLSDFVAEQNPIANSNALEDLIVSKETVYKVENEKVAAKLGVAEWNGSNWSR